MSEYVHVRVLVGKNNALLTMGTNCVPTTIYGVTCTDCECLQPFQITPALCIISIYVVANVVKYNWRMGILIESVANSTFLFQLFPHTLFTYSIAGASYLAKPFFVCHHWKYKPHTFRTYRFLLQIMPHLIHKQSGVKLRKQRDGDEETR